MTLAPVPIKYLVTLILLLAPLVACSGSSGPTADSWPADGVSATDRSLPLDRRPSDLALPDLAVPDLAADQFVPTGNSWARAAGGPYLGASRDRGNAVAVDSAGNLYITGSVVGAARFGALTFPTKSSFGYEDIFVARMSPLGKFLWVVELPGSKMDRGMEVTVDPKGNAVVLARKGYLAYSGVITKLDPAGKTLWSETLSPGAEAFGVATDAQANVYVTGYFSKQSTFGTITVTAQSQGDLFVACLDAAGTYQWINVARAGTSAAGASLGLDGKGRIYVAGAFSKTLQWGSTLLQGNGKVDGFVARLDAKHQFAWAVALSSTDQLYARAIAVEASGASYITGDLSGSCKVGRQALSSTESATLIARLGADGKAIWAVGAKGPSAGADIVLDPSGGARVTGHFQKTITLGSHSLTATGEMDTLLAGVDSKGNVSWVRSAGGTFDDYGSSLALDSSGHTTVIGSFEGSATFGSTTLSSQGAWDIFVWKSK